MTILSLQATASSDRRLLRKNSWHLRQSRANHFIFKIVATTQFHNATAFEWRRQSDSRKSGVQICWSNICKSGSLSWANRYRLRSIKIDLVAEASEQAKIIYLSPSHQNPTGVRLSSQRRSELLQLANGHMNGHSCFIIEDDTDCEYNYHSTNLPALVSSDTNDGVIYYNSFWKTLSPLVDIAI